MDRKRMYDLKYAPTIQIMMETQELEDEEGFKYPKERIHPQEKPISSEDK